jgi:hypothetical protein
LKIAVLLPIARQAIKNTLMRGLMFVLFVMSLGWVTFRLAPPEASFVGRAGPPDMEAFT